MIACAYSGTRTAALKDIVDAGHLLVPGDMNHAGRVVKIPTVKFRDELRGHPTLQPGDQQRDPQQIFTSPSIAYVRTPAVPTTACLPSRLGMFLRDRLRLQVSHPAYAEPIKFGGHTYNFVLQFRIQPGTYMVGPSTLKETPADPYVDESEMEWFTDRHGVHLLYSILVQKQ